MTFKISNNNFLKAKFLTGFTLIELMIVIGLAVATLGLVAVLGNQIIIGQELERGRELIRSELTLARENARAGTYDGAWGVAFFTNYITRFKGSSFANRDTGFDQTTNFAPGIVISGPSEIVFSRPFGLPQSTGTINIALSGRNYSLTINTTGSISSP